MSRPRELIKRRPTETAAAGAGTLGAALATAGVPVRLIPLVILILGWLPAAVTWAVETYRSWKEGEA